jgi:menaquinone-dependent protoporphyrinogen IX oxidase
MPTPPRNRPHRAAAVMLVRWSVSTDGLSTVRPQNEEGSVSGIIVYRSTYGSTKQYADWISEEIGFPAYDSRSKEIPWDGADTVVIGCPIIANKPFLCGWIEKNWNRMKGKNVILFTTSGADPADAPVKQWVEKALPEPLRSGMHVFPLAGRFDFARLNGPHKAMIWLAAVVFGNKDVKNQMRNPVDGVARENLGALLDVLKKQG